MKICVILRYTIDPFTMQVRQFLFGVRGLFCLILLCQLQVAEAQRLTTNENGEKIVLLEDGSWRYFDPAQDAALEEAPAATNRPDGITGDSDTMNGENPLVNPPNRNIKQKKKKDKTKKAKKDKGKKQKVAKNKSKSKKTKKKKNSGKVAKADKRAKSKAKKNKKGGNKKVASNKSGKAKAPVDAEAQRRSDNLAIRRAERAAGEVNKMERVKEDLALERVFLEEELKQAYSSLESTDADIAAIESRLRDARQQEEEAEANYKAAVELSKDYDRMVNMSYEKREKLLAKRQAESPGYVPSDGGGVVNVAPEPTISKAAQKVALEVKSKRLASDVMTYPPKPPCQVAFDGVDEFTGQQRRDLVKEPFFSYTNEQMRPFFKEKDFIECSGALSSIGGSIFLLSFELEVASQNAQRDYGFIEKGSILTIKFIDGSTVRIANRKTDTGALNPLEKSVIYKPQYTISSTQAKELSRGEVDKIRIVWSTGYEDYEVYELDFFINQFRCLVE